MSHKLIEGSGIPSTVRDVLEEYMDVFPKKTRPSTQKES